MSIFKCGSPLHSHAFQKFFLSINICAKSMLNISLARCVHMRQMHVDLCNFHAKTIYYYWVPGQTGLESKTHSKNLYLIHSWGEKIG